MLASLLPGLREVRTPLTVGYLWLLVIWLAFADKMPTERPASDNLIARWFDLGGLLGQPARLAALSFLAYVIGAIVTDVVEAVLRKVETLLRERFSVVRVAVVRVAPLPYEYSITEDSFRSLLSDEIIEVRAALGAPPTGYENLAPEKKKMIKDVELGENTPLSNLRSRLLVANQEVYGEYDRFAAEADFRVNLSLPTFALGILVAVQLGNAWGCLGLVLVAGVLLIQGRARGALADAVLMRAVLDGVIEHPVSARAREAIARLS